MEITQDTIAKAWLFAATAHKEQKYPIKELPYLMHIGSVVLEVVGVLDSIQNPTLALCCAILHDTIEDTVVTFEDIQKEFGNDIARGVAALSKNKNLAKEKQMRDSLERIKQEPKEVWIVKMADRVANLSKPPASWSLEKRKNYQKEATMILEYLGSANEKLAKRLASKITEYNHYIKE